MTDLHFAEPQWVHLLWAVFVFLLLLVWLERRGSGLLSRFLSGPLQERLVRNASSARRSLRIVFLALTGCFLVLALMRPQWGLQFVTTPRAGAEIMVCLDVSRSMLAEDTAPNRLERAKAELRDLLAYLDGDQVGLIAFAGRAAVISPMTPDFGFLHIVLEQAGPHSVSRGGTRLEEPIRKAIAGFGAAGDVSRSILLITDGEDHDSFPLEAAKDAAERGIRILAIGFGDETGSEIMFSDPKTGVRSLLRDSDGKPVSSRLDGDLLREIALQTEGAYIPAGTGVLDLESIYDRHIAGLTRGMLDGRGRSVRNDAFQWAVLLGLLCLAAAVASTSAAFKNISLLSSKEGKGDFSNKGIAPSAVWIGALLLAAAISGTQPADAEEPPPAKENPVGAAATDGEKTAPDARGDAKGDAKGESKTENEKTKKAEKTEKEEKIDPRESYNQGLARLKADEADAAEKLLEEARTNAGTDGETRFRATYNLGWVEIKRADAALEAEPQQALTALQRAADWFREAVSLRSGHTESRHNLETVLRRAMELADSLAKRDERDIDTRLQELIKTQREFLGGLRQGVDLGGSDEDPNSAQQSRRIFRGLSARQLEALSEGEALSEQAGQEVAALRAKTEEERTPEDAMRETQLDNLLHYVHRARERMGQTRTRLRRLQAERAYRRASAALTELKRARDQLLDPVKRLDALLADGIELARTTALKSALEDGLSGLGQHQEQQAPAWLTEKYLTETQSGLAERTSEFHQGLSAGLAQDPAAKGQGQAGGKEISPEQEQFIEQLREAEPMIGEADKEFADALAALEAGRIKDAPEPQARALTKLTEARERFLDLRGLIELLYQDENRIDTLLKASPERDSQEIGEYVPAAVEAQQKNIQRAGRVRDTIKREMLKILTEEEAEEEEKAAGGAQQQPPDKDAAATQAQRQRLEMADKLHLQVEQQMAQARQDLEAAEKLLEDTDIGVAISGHALNTAGNSVTEALAAVEELRRLFFSVVEHLKETARQQQELNDETEEVRGLAEAREAEETAKALGPLAPRQGSLADRAGTINDALNQQAEHQAKESEKKQGQNQKPSPQPPQQNAQEAADTAERMRQAAEHVATAQTLMLEANTKMKDEPPGLDDIRKQQDEAMEKLLEAVALLEPPQQQDQQQDQQQQQEQQQDNKQGEQEKEQEQPKQTDDLRQLLQGVRDREAQRREDQEKNRPGSYEPVEKDW
ncbi:MAG: VWA domain-containing protein [Gammaproteobacteria bacterium]|nr:VWA domain-containing protein [Gammaproteobacteria bacterium]